MVNIAIVEDNKTTREGLEAIVNLSPDYRCVCTCETAEDALRHLPKSKPDVVLMDIQLPKMSGVECVAQLRELLPSVQFIMVTVYRDQDRIFSALRAGASGYILKRATPEKILNAIRDVLLGEVPMSAEIARKVIAYFHDQTVTAAKVKNLSPREREILDLTVKGLSYKEISVRLGISVDTIRWHTKGIFNKLHVHSRTEAVLKFHPPV